MFDYRTNDVDRPTIKMKKGQGQAFVTQGSLLFFKIFSYFQTIFFLIFPSTVSMSGNKVAVSDTENQISLYDLREPSKPCHIFCPDTTEPRVYVRDAQLDGGLLFSLHNSNQYQVRERERKKRKKRTKNRKRERGEEKKRKKRQD